MPECQTLSKALDIYIKCYIAGVARDDLLKATAILSDTTVRRYAVEQEDLQLPKTLDSEDLFCWYKRKKRFL